MCFYGCVVATTVLSRAGRPCVGKEFWAIIGVGAALGALVVTGHGNIDSRFDSVDSQFDSIDRRLGRVEGFLFGIEQVAEPRP